MLYIVITSLSLMVHVMFITCVNMLRISDSDYCTLVFICYAVTLQSKKKNCISSDMIHVYTYVLIAITLPQTVQFGSSYLATKANICPEKGGDSHRVGQWIQTVNCFRWTNWGPLFHASLGPQLATLHGTNYSVHIILL